MYNLVVCDVSVGFGIHTPHPVYKDYAGMRCKEVKREEGAVLYEMENGVLVEMYPWRVKPCRKLSISEFVVSKLK